MPNIRIATVRGLQLIRDDIDRLVDDQWTSNMIDTDRST